MSMMTQQASSRLRSLPSIVVGGNEQGMWYDPNELTYEKIKWRRNLTTYSEGSLSSWGSSNVTDAGSSIAGFAASLQFGDNSLQRYAYKAVSMIKGTTYTVSMYVEMDDGLAPVPGTNTSSGDFAINGAGGATGGTITVEHISGAVYRVKKYNVATSTASTNCGPVKYATQTSRTFRVTGIQIEVGSTATSYQKFTDFSTEFIAAFPKHSLFQDAAGQTPVAKLGEPLGLIVDKRFDFDVGAEIITNQTFDTATGWQISGTASNNWTISGGVANANGPSSASSYLGWTAGTGNLVAGVAYVLEFDILTSNGVGGVKPTSSTDNPYMAGVAILTTGHKRMIFTTGGTNPDYFQFQALTGWIGTIDNVSLRRLPGNHAYQTSSASRPTIDARVNMLTRTYGQFDDAAWVKSAIVGSDNRITTNTSNSIHICYHTFQHVPDTSVRYRIQVAKKEGFGFFQLCFNNPARVKCTINLNTGEYVKSTIGGADATITVNDTGSGRWEITMVGSNAAAMGVGYFNMGLTTALTGVTVNSYDEPIFTGSGEYMDLYECDLRRDVDSVYGYQRVNTSTDYEDVGVNRSIMSDGVDDFLITPLIDFSSTDKVTMVAGYRNMSPTTIGVLAELSASSSANNGTFGLAIGVNAAGSALTDGHQFAINGTSLYRISKVVSGNAVSSCVADLALASADLAARINTDGSGFSASGTDAGTGYLGNYAFYIFRRGGTTLPAAARLYGLFVVGNIQSDDSVKMIEKWMNQKTRAF